MRTCSCCGKEKRDSLFASANDYYCKACRRKYNNVYRDLNADRIKSWSQDYYARNREKIKKRSREYYHLKIRAAKKQARRPDPQTVP